MAGEEPERKASGAEGYRDRWLAKKPRPTLTSWLSGICSACEQNTEQGVPDCSLICFSFRTHSLPGSLLYAYLQCLSHCEEGQPYLNTLPYQPPWQYPSHLPF